MLKKTILLILSIFFILVVLPKSNKVISPLKTSHLPSITVINLIRSKELGHEKDNLFSSLKDQFKITADQDIKATWLLQYSVLEDKQMTDFAKNKMENQEFGLLFEIDRNFTKKSNVLYKGQGPSYFSDGLLLVSYDVSERRKLIDTAFKKFKSTFGYYPKTVGAWWIGADSLVYMQKKYGIVAALKASDQFNLDVYTIWGTPFSIPYFASSENEGMPANSFDKSSKVVILQWAARDLLLGYENNLFSIQDNYANGYAQYLLDNYLKNANDDVVIGVENGGDLKVFKSYYQNMLTLAVRMQSEKKVSIDLAKNYAKKFLLSNEILSRNYILYNGFESSDQAFWYTSENFRVFIQKIKDKVYLTDFRDYSIKKNEDFFLLPNSQGDIRINEPAILDTRRFPNNKVLLIKNKDILSIQQNKQLTSLYTGNIKLASFTKKSAQFFSNSSFFKYSKIYNFNKQNVYKDVFLILMFIYLTYFILNYFVKNNIKIIKFENFLLLIPLLLALPFLSKGNYDDITFLFDRKEVFFLNFFPFSSSISNSILEFEVIPLLLLLLSHFILIVRSKRKYAKYLYFVIIYLISTFYLHFPYFPLDKSTYKLVSLIAFIILICFVISCFHVFKKTKSIKKLSMSIFVFCFLALTLMTATFFSRTKIAITPFETQALQFIKNSKQEVLFEYKSENSPLPIYKAVRPFLFDYYKIAQNITNTKWDLITRPKNNVLNISNYDNKLIVVPRYLGVDLSEFEIKTLNLKKIFDNAQIAIFEKI